MKHRRGGLTIVEVLVAMAILAILAATLVGVLPTLSRNTRAATIDTEQSQTLHSIFELVASAWSNEGPYDAREVDGVPVETLVFNTLGSGCEVVVTPLPTVATANRQRLVITCEANGNLPERSLRAEYGDPRD